MPTPQAHADTLQAAADFATQAGPAAITAVATWFLARHKNAAEAARLEADAKAIIAKIVDERLATASKMLQSIADQRGQELDRLKAQQATLWVYIETLRGMLLDAGVKAPPAPPMQ